MFGACACALQARALERPLAAPVFRVFGTEQGLPSRQVQALAQDHDGRLWIATANGLVRFDGHGFVTYPARLERPNALATTSVEALTLDAADQLWVATQGGQLARRRGATDDFARVDLQSVPHDEQLEIWALAAAAGHVFVGTYGAGLLVVDQNGRLEQQIAVPAALGGPNVLDLLASADGSLWMITYDRRQLLEIDVVRHELRAIAGSDGKPAPYAYGMGAHGDELWYSTPEGALCRVGADRMARCAPLPQLAQPGRVRLLLSGERGDWLGGTGELLHQVDGASQRIAFQTGRIGGVPQQQLWTGLVDRDRGLWFGTSGGGLLHLPADADRFQVWQPDPSGAGGLRDGRVRGVARDGHGRVWVATLNAGLHRMTPETGAIAALPLPGTDQRRVWAVLATASDELWVGYHDGVLQLHVDAAGQLQLLRQWPAAALVGGIVDLLYRDVQGQIWAASVGAGMNRIDPVSAQVLKLPFSSTGLAGTEVQQIGTGADQRVWVASDHALQAFDPGCACWQTLIGDARVDAYTVTGSRVTAFVDGQLVSYQWRNGLFRDEAVAPREFDDFQTVGGMVAVGDALWLAGPQGLYRYRPDSDRLDGYDTRDGLPTREFSDRPIYTDADGRLWIGSEDGLVSLDPTMTLADPPAARLRFDRLSVDGPLGARSLTVDGVAELQPDDRELQVVVRLSTLARPQAQRFSFRLAGWEGWSAPAQRPERRLGALAPGDYALEVRAWDGYGQPATNALHWRFRVLPPWWRSDIAWGAYLLLGLLLIGLIESWRRRRRHAASMLAESRRQAQWAERLAAERTTLVAELSHEIRNPLNGVLGMGRLLAEQPLPAAARRYLDLMVDAGRQLTRLLDNMLDWTRLDARAQPLACVPAALLDLLRPTLDRYAQQADERGLAFQVAIDAALQVQVDPPRLCQIVENLLSNALKFTSQGVVRVSASVVEAGIALRINDSGIGMSDAELARLFRPFERVGDERAAPGTGLGLAISRNLVERMGGTLTVESEAGVGTCFVVTLAAAFERTSEDHSAAATTPDAPAKSRPLAGLRLLLVEDDALAREVLTHELSSAGAHLAADADALSALIRLQSEHFDAALIDWDLPGMSGVDLARSLRAQLPALPLIAVTGRATPADRALALEAGFAAHLAKPVQPELLLATLVAVCGKLRSGADR